MRCLIQIAPDKIQAEPTEVCVNVGAALQQQQPRQLKNFSFEKQLTERLFSPRVELNGYRPPTFLLMPDAPMNRRAYQAQGAA